MTSLDLFTFTWRELTDVKGTKPSPRDKFGFWVHGQKIIYFGGFGHPPENWNTTIGEFRFEDFPHSWGKSTGWNNHLFILDTVALRWYQPKTTGECPSPRAAFSTSQISDNCFLFGGRFQVQRRNDLFMLNTKSFHWTEIKPLGVPPCGRSWHIMENASENHLFVYGGFDNEGNALKDTWLYDIAGSTWIELKNVVKHSETYSPRMWHTACKTDSPGEVVIFGGCVNSIIGRDSTSHTNQISVFRFSPLSLRRQCLDYIMKNIGSYCKHGSLVMDLPHSLRRDIRQRCSALGLHSPTGHGKLISNCQVM